MKAAWLALALAGCATYPEYIRIPGTSLRLELLRVSDDVSLATRETTWEDFDAFYEHPEEEVADGVTRPSVGKSYLGLSGLPSEFMEPKRPVVGVRRHAALMYCEWLSQKTGFVFRLPTEAEWRAADVGGDDGWTAANSDGAPHPVGQRPPNSLGFYDLRGNAWEYLLDAPDVQIGGGWTSSPGEGRRTIPADWIQADPSRPPSVWWFRTDFSQGFRVLRSDGIPGPVRGLDVRILGSEEVGQVRRVRGELLNRDHGTFEEVGVKVYYLTPDGRPHLTDVSGEQNRRATFNVVYPVLAGQTSELKAGGRVEFVVDVPLTYDPEDRVRADGFGASVLSYRAGPNLRISSSSKLRIR